MKTTKATGSGSIALNKLLAKINRECNFLISVLTDQNGLPIAFATRQGFDPDRQSAVVAMIQKTASQVGRQLGMGQADEINMFDANGQRLVCRPFTASGHDLILSVMMPERKQSYRRATSQAIQEICQIWSKYWE